MEIKINIDWKNRLLRWAHDLVLIFSMWSIWLVRVYLIDIFYANVVTGFLIVIIVLTVLYEEYYESMVDSLDAQLKVMQNRK